MTSRIFRSANVALFATLVASIFVSFLTACSSGFQAQGSTASLNGSSSVPSSGSDSGGSSAASPTQAFQNVSMDATVQAPSVGTVLAVTLDKPNMQLVIHLPIVLGTSGIIIGNQFNITQLPGTTLGFETVGSTTALTLRIPLSTVMHGASFLPNGKLPNGDSLSTVGIPDGELPNLGLSLNNTGTMKASLFLSTTVVGLFMTSPVDPYLSVEVRLQMANKTTIGYFSTVPAKTTSLGAFPGGFFLSVKIPNDIALIIDDVL